MNSNYSVFSPLTIVEPPIIATHVRPYPRKVSQKERRKKARYLRSQGLKWRYK